MKDASVDNYPFGPTSGPKGSESVSDYSGDEFLDHVIILQNGLIARATGEVFDGGNAAYRRYRLALMGRPDIRHLLPLFLRRCSDLGQFWGWIKYEKPSYAERRDLIWDGFRPLIEHLENRARIPSDDAVTATLGSLDSDGVREMWQRALDRRVQDPEGAITLAKSILETVCKHILDDSEDEYDRQADLPKLWSLAGERLNLAPSQHQEKLFRAILGNCQAVVGSLAAIRNRLGDAHGQGRRPVRPQPRHAELAVNLAGSMASFLVATWENWKRRQN